MYSGPFKWWVQSVMPLVFDDSLSYYEVLAKLTKYIEGLTGDVQEIEKVLETIEGIGDITEFTKFLETIQAEIGDLNNLQTVNKSNLVSAINEIALKANNAYIKPSGGIPESDLSQNVQDKLNRTGDITKYIINNRELKAAPSNNSPTDLGLGTYSVPAGGIPWDTLSDDVKNRIESGSGGEGGTKDYTDLSNKPQINGHTLNAGNNTNKSLGLGTYNKPDTGIPESDLSAEVQEKLNTSGGIADSEISFVATRDYEAGELIYINGVLYKTKYKILSGTNLVPGNNIEVTDISAEIERINNDIDNLQSGSGPDSWNLKSNVTNNSTSVYTNFFEYFNAIGGENYLFIITPGPDNAFYQLKISKKDDSWAHYENINTGPNEQNQYRFTFTPADTGEYYCAVRKWDVGDSRTVNISVSLEYTQSQGISELWDQVNKASGLEPRVGALETLVGEQQEQLNELDGIYATVNRDSTLWENVSYNGTVNLKRLSTFVDKSFAKTLARVVPPNGYKISLSADKYYVWTGSNWSSANLYYNSFLDISEIPLGNYNEYCFTIISDDDSDISANVGGDVQFICFPNMEVLLLKEQKIDREIDVFKSNFFDSFDNNILFGAKLYEGYYIDITGTKVFDTNYFSSDYIEVEPSAIYRATNTSGFFISLYDSNKNRLDSTATTEGVFVTSSNTRYVIISLYKTRITTSKIFKDRYICYGKDAYDMVYQKIPNVYTVGTGQTYTTLRAGVAAAVQEKNSIVYVLPGIYDLIDEFIDSISASMGVTGIALGNGVHIVFMAGSKVTALFDNSENQYDATTWRRIYDNFSPFYASLINGNANFTLENLEIEASNTRYCVHDELSGNGTYIHEYRNCKMKYINNHSDVNYVNCIGGGLGEHGTIIIDGGYYQSVTDYGYASVGGNPMDSQQAITFHNGYNSNCLSKITVKNVYLADRGYFRFSDYGPTTNKSLVQVSGCSVGLATNQRKEGGDTSIPDQFELNQFCCDVRVPSHWVYNQDGTATLVED